jgi:hypothetical protein
VVVFFSSLWNGVDFTAKLLQPWANMKNGPSPAQGSIFLDLISPIWPSALGTAFKTGSIVPVLTISGVALLNIVVSLTWE